jgi:outer membrane lipoprotein LolB
MSFFNKMFSKPVLSKCLSRLPKWRSIKKGSDVTQFSKRWLPVLVALFLSGCASFQQPQVAEIPLPAQERQQQLATLNQFELNAALNVKAPGESVTSSLNWVQQGEFYTADLNNFVGINIFKLQTTAEGALVQVSGEQHQAATAAALLEYLSGWSLPIEEMPLWLKGMTGSGSTDLRFDPMGRLTSFTLLDSQNRRWQVSYTKFFPDRLSLPSQIILESSDTKLKLGIRQWKML